MCWSRRGSACPSWFTQAIIAAVSMDSYPKPTLATEETARERERERLTEREKVGVLRPAEREKELKKLI